MHDIRPHLRLVGADAAAGPGLADALRAAEPRVHLLAASVLIEAGALEAAWEPISTVARTSDDPRLREQVGDQLLLLARGWEGRHEHRAAGGALRLAAQLVPARAIPALARHLQREGSTEEALSLWAEAVRLEPLRADHHLHHGRLLEAQGRYQEAHAAYLRLVEELPGASTALTVAPRLERLAARLRPAPDAVVRIAMLGSATLDQLRDCLAVQAHRAGLRPEMHLAGADRYAEEVLDADSALHRFEADLLILAVHRSRLFPELDDIACRLSAGERREAVRSGLDAVRDLLRAFRARSSAPVLLHNMVVPQRPLRVAVDTEDTEVGQADFHQVNVRLARLVATEFDDVHLVDEDAVQARCGKAGATDPRLWLAAGLPWSESLLVPLALEELRHLLACRGRAPTGRDLGGDTLLWESPVAAGPRRHRSRADSREDTTVEEQVRAVIAASFNLDEDDLPTPASRETIPGWTSRSQMTLVLNLEERFDVSFSLEQMVSMTSAQRITEALRRTPGPVAGP
jgi:acyl carrier protein/tetratricopeptide (TPR) repeat protein